MIPHLQPMKISLSWLQDFIALTEPDHNKIKDLITERTAEVETLERQGEGLDKVVVGQIKEIRKHPNADSLSLTQVWDGQETAQVVCGGSNLREGMKVAFAQLGAVVRWHGEEVVEMKKAKIRGEESFGMICAAEEIGLAEMFPKKSEKEIVDLSGLEAPVGTPLAQALQLDDAVMDIDNHAITNRSDLFSQRGFAREFVANGLGEWKEEKAVDIPRNGSPAPIQVTIESPELCPRYLGVYLTGVEVKESPEWMRRRLIACGINAISNLVDITNYVMLELGMPMHAFDLERIQGKSWAMRASRKGEKMTTLDGAEHELPEGTIVLNDGHENFDLCGIMGGLSSGIQAKTEKIWLHAPVFPPTLVRKAMRSLGHISDAGIIYEKGVDPELAKAGLERAVELILELCPSAKVASEVMDIRHQAPEKRVIELRLSRIRKLIGVEVKPQEVEKILKDLGFVAEKAEGGYQVSVPSWRQNDVGMEADLIEEIARIHGFNSLPELTPVKSIAPIPANARREREKRTKNALTAWGWDELYSFAFLGPELLRKTGLETSEEMIEVANPLSGDLSLMRTSLLPRTLEAMAENLRYQKRMKVFELSRVYRKTGAGHEERSALILASAGEDFGVVQGAAEALGLTAQAAEISSLRPWQHPGRAATLMLRGKPVGELYELHPSIAKAFDIKTRVAVAEIDFEALHRMELEPKAKYSAIPRFPAVQLDVSVLTEKKQSARELLEAIEKTDKSLIAKAELIDDYSGEKIPDGKRALTYSITYQAAERTLTEPEVAAVHQQVLKKLEAKGAEVRR